jgi:hypothetical protein
MKRVTTNFLHVLWENTDTLILILIMECWQFLTKTPLNTRTALTVGAICVIFRFFGAKREIDAYAAGNGEKE